MTNNILSHGSRVSIASSSARNQKLASDLQCAGIDGDACSAPTKPHCYNKLEAASRVVHTLGWLKNVYTNAIEFTAMAPELRGMAFMYGIAFGTLITLGLGGCGVFAMYIGSLNSWQETLILCGGVLMAVVGVAVGTYLFALLGRIDLFRPSDLPIIFDRKHRKVYRLLRDEQPGFRGMFMRWPILACEYDWDLVDAEHHIDTFASAASIHRNHSLVFLVRRSRDDSTVIDSFQIANAHALGENLVDPLWEHIRRFMEEDGPHLPHPTEPLVELEPPLSWWASMGVVGAFGPKFSTHWRNAPVLTLIILLLFPVTLPILLLWGTGNYLSFKTQIAAEWPALVLERIGAPTATAQRSAP